MKKTYVSFKPDLNSAAVCNAKHLAQICRGLSVTFLFSIPGFLLYLHMIVASTQKCKIQSCSF